MLVYAIQSTNVTCTSSWTKEIPPFCEAHHLSYLSPGPSRRISWDQNHGSISPKMHSAAIVYPGCLANSRVLSLPPTSRIERLSFVISLPIWLTLMLDVQSIFRSRTYEQNGANTALEKKIPFKDVFKRTLNSGQRKS